MTRAEMQARGWAFRRILPGTKEHSNEALSLQAPRRAISYALGMRIVMRLLSSSGPGRLLLATAIAALSLDSLCATGGPASRSGVESLSFEQLSAFAPLEPALRGAPYDPSATFTLKGLDPSEFSFQVTTLYSQRGNSLDSLTIDVRYGSEAVGHIFLEPHPKEPDALWASGVNIYADAGPKPRPSRFQGKGLGTLMYLMAARLAGDLGYKDVVSTQEGDALQFSDDAKRLWERLEAYGVAQSEGPSGARQWRTKQARVRDATSRAYPYFLIQLQNPEELSPPRKRGRRPTADY